MAGSPTRKDAAAEVLVAGEERGAQAKLVFSGLFAGLGYKALGFLARFWPTTAELPIPRYRAAQVSVDMSPELMGVGYIIGLSFVRHHGRGRPPLLARPHPRHRALWPGRPSALLPGHGPHRPDAAGDIWNRYIRYIGAGAVAAGGIINLMKALPTIVDSFRASFRDLRLTAGGERSSAGAPRRTSPSRSCSSGRSRWPSSWRSFRSSRPCRDRRLHPFRGRHHGLRLLLLGGLLPNHG